MTSNQDKIILDLCGGTGAWSAPYAGGGYDVRLLTLPMFDVTKTYIGEDELVFFPPEGKIGKKMRVPFVSIYGILAAPPCTMFSLARTTAKTPRDFNEGMAAVQACLEIIWSVRKKHKLTFWALENPMGYLRQFLGKPPLTFDPCDYGDGYTKRTDLWGYYNAPTKRPRQMTEDEIARCAINNRKYHGPPVDKKGVTDWQKWGNNFGNRRQAMLRAITPAGFATQFFNANK